MADHRELRMNLAAIKRVDPYAKDIVDSSAHVAFYTYNSTDAEWEKTDVEGAFFIYSRNAEPFYNIFINNRLNTNSLVEPIAGHFELQNQPPFLLYRNDRDRIRGFWFYNKAECDRIGELVEQLIKDCEKRHQQQQETITGSGQKQQQQQLQHQPQKQQQNIGEVMAGRQTSINNNVAPVGVDIYTMLSKAQEDFNNAKVSSGPPPAVKTDKSGGGTVPQPPPTTPQQQQQQPPGDGTSQSVMNFFAAAKPATAKEVPFFQRLLSHPVHVDQIEKQHRTVTPHEKQHSPPQQSHPIPIQQQHQHQHQQQQKSSQTNSVTENGIGFIRINSPNIHELGTSPLATFINTNNLSGMNRPSGGGGVGGVCNNFSELELQPLHQLLKKNDLNNTPGKPALMPPTMFTSAGNGINDSTQTKPMNQEASQLQQQQQQQHPPQPPPGFTLQPLHIREPMQQSVAPIPMQQQQQQPQPRQQPNKVLGAIQMLATNQSAAWHPHLNNDGMNAKPEPLTQTQLLQAMGYLIKNDPDFVRKLHEAYLKSFTEMVSL